MLNSEFFFIYLYTTLSGIDMNKRVYLVTHTVRNRQFRWTKVEEDHWELESNYFYVFWVAEFEFGVSFPLRPLITLQSLIAASWNNQVPVCIDQVKLNLHQTWWKKNFVVNFPKSKDTWPLETSKMPEILLPTILGKNLIVENVSMKTYVNLFSAWKMYIKNLSLWSWNFQEQFLKVQSIDTENFKKFCCRAFEKKNLQRKISIFDILWKIDPFSINVFLQNLATEFPEKIDELSLQKLILKIWASLSD